MFVYFCLFDADLSFWSFSGAWWFWMFLVVSVLNCVFGFDTSPDFSGN